MARLEAFAKTRFYVDAATLLEAIRLSPNAQGYISGAVSELVVRQYFKLRGFELKRIKEKWIGKKKHHGDFYIKKKNSPGWYVLETKGVKSNSEKWHKLNERGPLERFLKKWNEGSKVFGSNDEIIAWCNKNFKSNLEELRIKVLESHFVAKKGGQRKINTPRNDEFDYLAVDLSLRTAKRQFIFARPNDLPPSRSHSFHLKQNYVIDVLLDGLKNKLSIKRPWHLGFNEIFDDAKDPIRESDMQEDDRHKFLRPF